MEIDDYLHQEVVSRLGWQSTKYLKSAQKADPKRYDFSRHRNISIIEKTPTHALFIQHYISLAC